MKSSGCNLQVKTSEKNIEFSIIPSSNGTPATRVHGKKPGDEPSHG